MRRRWYWAIGSFILSAGLAWVGWQLISSRRFESELTCARTLMDVHKFADARDLLAKLQRRSPFDPETSYRLGVCEHSQGRFDAAVSAWSLPDLSTEWGFRSGLARARTLIGDMGRFSEAETVFESLVKSSLPRGKLRDDARRSLAELYFWEGRRDAVRRILEDGWGNSTDPIGELRDHWRAETSPTLIEKIRAEINQAGEIAPDDDRVWLSRASLAGQLGDYDEARRWLDRCLKSRPEDPVVWRARLDLARATDEPGEVTRALKMIPADHLTEAERLELRVWLARAGGSKNIEREALEKLVKENPGETRALERLASLCSESGERERARELRLRKAELDASKDRYRAMMDEELKPSAFKKLATLSETLGRTFEARGWWTLHAAFSPGDPSARLALKKLGKASDPRRHGDKTRLADLLADVVPKSTLPAIDAYQVAGAQSRKSVPRFRDDAAAAGLTFTFDNGRSPQRQIPETTAGGVGLIDYDGDGWFDVYVVQGGAFPADPSRPYAGDRLYRNKGDGRFEDATEKSGIAKMSRGFGHGVTVGDVDNDGHSDLFITRWRGYRLYRNKGDGTFEDATERFGLGGDRDWPTSAAFADFDNDGDLDLYVAHYLAWDAEHPTLCPRVTVSKTDELSDPGQRYNYCTPRPFHALPDHLFRNDGGKFIDVTAEAGIIDKDGRGLGVVAADLDDDGLVDLFVANDTTANYLWHNLGGFKFEEIGISSGVACNADGAYQAGMGTACGDLDGDGRPDLFVTNFYGESTTFFQNFGKGTFFDRTTAVGLAAPSQYLLGFGIVLFDVNNDGRLDLATANGHVNDDRPDYPYAMPALLMVGGENGQLGDVTRAAGEPWTVPRVARGLAAGDLDNDGKMDALVLSQQSPLGYFHNVKAEGMGRFVTFQLQGTKSNRDGVGAAVSVKAGGKTSRAWRLGGGSFQSASDPRLHFGLAGAAEIEEVQVRWPSGATDTFGHVEADRLYLLKEGAERPTALKGRQTGP